MNREDKMKEEMFEVLTDLFFNNSDLLVVKDLQGLQDKVNKEIMPLVGEIYAAGYNDGSMDEW